MSIFSSSIYQLFLAVFFSLASLVFADLNFERQVIDDKISIGYGLAIGDVDGDQKT